MSPLEAEALEFVRALIRIDSVNTGDAATIGDGETRAALFVQAQLEEVGYETVLVEPRPGRASVVARLAGSDPDAGALVAHAHLDVVPVDAADWTHPPFGAEIHDGVLYGRGAVDMKGAIAAMVCAVEQIPAGAGTISFIITGDEEGPAKYGTVPLIAHMREVGALPDFCLVGEPTSVNRLGDMVKIGRRGSVNLWLTASGTQGHVAYPHLADNPIPRLVALLAELDALVLDEGTDWFQPSNLEITDLEVGNRATNVIPAEARARLSIRYNDRHTGQGLVDRITQIAAGHRTQVRATLHGEAFITLPGAQSALVAAAVEAETGLSPELSTTGGTSDARFLRALCPVIEFGLTNATMHKTDEAVAVADLAALVRIYRRIALSALS